MTRALTVAAICALAALAISACGGNDAQSSTTDQPPPAGGSAEAQALEQAIAETTSDRDQYRETLTASCLESDKTGTFDCELGPEGDPYAVEVLENGSFIARPGRGGPTIMGSGAR